MGSLNQAQAQALLAAASTVGWQRATTRYGLICSILIAAQGATLEPQQLAVAVQTGIYRHPSPMEL